MIALVTHDDPEAVIAWRAGQPVSVRTLMQDAAQQGNLVYGVDQKLPLWGKPELSRRVALAEVATQQANLASRVQWLRRDIAKALFRIALAERVIFPQCRCQNGYL